MKILVENKCQFHQKAMFYIGQELHFGTAFQLALQLNQVNTALYLYHAGYSLNMEDYLDDKNCMPDIFQANSSLMRYFIDIRMKYYLNQPKSLYELCFSVIWCSIFPGIEHKVHRLPLPYHLKTRLSYKGTL